MIDLHCHLDLYPDPTSVVAECIRRNLYVLSVTTTPSAWAGTIKLAGGSARIRTALGLHPQLASERKHELTLFDKLLSESRYVGEIGLDGSPDLALGWKDQLMVFQHILHSCRRAGGRVMSIHSRGAAGPVIELLRKNPNAGVPVLHWFSGSATELDQAISSNCWFSVGYAMLHTAKGQSLVMRMPRERVLTETDGPFVRIGTHPIMPWEVSSAVSLLSAMWNCDTDTTYARIAENLKSLVTTLL